MNAHEELLTKADIMDMYKCGNAKALNLLKFMYQMGYGMRIDKTFYVTKNNHDVFLRDKTGANINL